MSRPMTELPSRGAMDATLQLAPARWKQALFLAVALLFVWGGMFLVRIHPVAGWLNVGFFGLAALLNRWRTTHGGHGADDRPAAPARLPG